ncbi:TULIP family P47-like protein [Psychrosphaera haliotis]|nr:TULIP family P47-like protein [Psychrosphaera haliotis]
MNVDSTQKVSLIEGLANTDVIHMRFPHLTSNPPRKTFAKSMALLGSGAIADTYNWDTVYAIKFPDANIGLAKEGATPKDFSTSADGATASGTFNPWQLSGGAGILLHMTIPIDKGNTVYQNTTYPMDGAVATIELELKALAGVSGNNGTPNDVIPDATKPVSVTNLTNVPGDPSFIVKAVMSGLIEKWLTDNLVDFKHAFSTVTLNETADKDQFQWMKPTGLGWAVSAQGSLADNVFGMLCMTEKRAVPNSMQISPNAIPSGQRAGFLIAQDRVLEKLVKPGVNSLFEGSVVGDFEVVNDGTMLRNVNTVYMDPVKLGAGTYKPKLEPGHFQLTLEANEIKMELIKAEVDFSPGIKIMMDYTAFSSMELALNSKGEQIIVYKEASAPIIDHNVEVAAWVTWATVAASVLAAVATLGFGSWAKTAIERVVIRVIAVVIVLIVGELIANIGTIITAVAEGEKDKIPPVTLMVASATDPIVWPDSKNFLITSAGLNVSMQFGGNPQFS